MSKLSRPWQPLTLKGSASSMMRAVTVGAGVVLGFSWAVGSVEAVVSVSALLAVVCTINARFNL